MRSIAIVGASLAGTRAAETLRRDGFDGAITIIGDEPHQPYDRPPLSKQVLAGEWQPDRILLSDGAALGDLDVGWRLGHRAVGLDVATRTVTLDSGSPVTADGILIATGARCRELPTGGLDGIHTLRGLDDCLAIRAELEATPRRVVVVGAGFIGAEVAATARGRGLEVTVVEALPVPLGRVLGPEIGTVCAEVHRDHGVDLRLGVGVDGFEGHGRVERVNLGDGTSVDADVVVVGIGVIPNTGWLEGSGLELNDGVVCDETCLAAPGIAAAGDVARWPNRLFGETMRVEHWDNAIEQGQQAVRRLLTADGKAQPYAPVPWFWSDQYDRKIQLAGRVRPDDEVRIVTGSTTERRFAALYGRAGRLVGVLGFNRPRHVMKYRQLVARGAGFEEALAVAAREG
ncbi:NAD(P)/FAD-dependent oxidoreductase [Candidatus Poriferisocius sp.]|uniref:NAD(P)/FAD-dependent oxidoreductase n=1 Tax=Candidatus Poriferisocius sp. TaxID=3101276 RepID=UPI003B02A6F5